MHIVLCIYYVLYMSGYIYCQISMSPKIVGGKYTNISSYPFSALVHVKCVSNIETRYWQCGASILNQQILLSAAHCLAECSINSYITGAVGASNYKQGNVRSVESFVSHEFFLDTDMSFDIALIKLKKRLKFNSMTSRVILMRKPPYNEMARVGGWGRGSETSDVPEENLKFVEQNVLTKSDCDEIFHEAPHGTLCASGNTINDYVSIGDSGSALVVRGNIQIGITSFKKPTLNKNVAVFTDTGHFYNWIMRNSKRLYCNDF